MDTFFYIITVFFILFGFLGILIPVLPGVLLSWVAIFLYAAFVDQFQLIGFGALFWMTIIAWSLGTSDMWMPLLGAKTVGASPKAIRWGVIGGTVGFIAGSFIPVIGNLIGGLVGYVGGMLWVEYKDHGDWQKAVKVGLGSLAGMGLATAIKFLGGLIIAIIFFALTL